MDVVVRDDVLGDVLFRLRVLFKEDLGLLLQLLVDVFEEILAGLVRVDLGKRGSADAFVLTFES